jgi:uncharacterized membrane protein YeaQ/YmgE (transglycosylase-associated protein family)
LAFHQFDGARALLGQFELDPGSIRDSAAVFDPARLLLTFLPDKLTAKKECFVINVVVWLVFGGLIGLVAGSVLGTNGSRSALAFNVAVGMVGAFIGGVLFGGSTISSNLFSVGALLIALVGAVILSAFATFFRRGAVRWQ